MARKATIEFVEVDSPCTNLVTKFGGQPVWLDAPQWPLSRSTGKPMQFICQIALVSDLFPNAGGKMAYLFMTGEEEEFVDGTYEPDGGENAVIIQPGRTDLPTICNARGPALYRMAEGRDRLVSEPCEFVVRFTYGDEPDFVPEAERWEMAEEEQARLANKLDENKIGGTPVFMQGDQFPEGGRWRLLLQLDSCSVPFYINFGDAGVGYAFLNEEGTEGKFLWQCG